MRILMVTNIYPTPDYPGRGSFVKAQIDSLLRSGFEVELMYINAIDSKLAFIKKTISIFKRSFSSEIDVIHAHYGTCGIVSRLQWRKPVVVSFLGSDLLGDPHPTGGKTTSSMIVVTLCRFFSFLFDAVIVKSLELRTWVPKKHNVFIIPNGVNFSLFEPVDSHDARQKLNLDADKKYILFPSNPDWKRKRLDLARSAVELLKGKGWDVELLTVYGKPQQQLPLYMNASNAMVLPSMWEGSPNVVKESMACNCPIVATDVGDVADVIQNTEACFLAKPEAHDFADKLDRILKWGKRTNGRDNIKHLDDQAVALKIARLYHTVARGRSYAN